MKEISVDRLPVKIHSRLNEITLVSFLTISAMYLFFAADLANKILVYLNFDLTRISIIPRSFYEFLFIGVILMFANKNRFRFLLIVFMMFFLFIIGQLIFSIQVGGDYNFTENILIYNKYFFVFIVYFAIYKIQYDPIATKRVVSVMENLFLLNAYLTIVGFIFGLDIFRTYVTQPYRYGYSGILWVQNEASILYFLAISYFYYKHFILRQSSMNFYLILITSVLLGTKAIYLFLIMLLVFHFLNNSNLRTKITVSVLIATIYWIGAWFLQTEQAKEILAYFVSKTDLHGLWYVLFSGRTFYLDVRGDEILSNWTFINYLIGGQDQSRLMIEMDFFDLFFFMGVIGTLVYFILIFTTIFKFRLTKPFNLFFVFSYLALAFLGGHFFTSVINAVYLCVISLFIYSSQIRDVKPENEKGFTN